QCMFFVFCYHARSSIGWQALFVVAVHGAAMGRTFVATPRVGRARLAALAIPATLFSLFVLAFTCLIAYRHVMYAPRYFVDMGERTVWHNALMGLGSNAEIARVYKLGVNDAQVVDAVIDYLRTKRDPRLTHSWTVTNILGSFGGNFDTNWQEYESAARDLYFSVWWHHFGDALHVYVIDKPLEVVNVLRQSVRNDGIITRRVTGLSFNPFSLGSAI